MATRSAAFGVFGGGGGITKGTIDSSMIGASMIGSMIGDAGIGIGMSTGVVGMAFMGLGASPHTPKPPSGASTCIADVDATGCTGSGSDVEVISMSEPRAPDGADVDCTNGVTGAATDVDGASSSPFAAATMAPTPCVDHGRLH